MLRLLAILLDRESALFCTEVLVSVSSNENWSFSFEDTETKTSVQNNALSLSNKIASSLSIQDQDDEANQNLSSPVPTSPAALHAAQRATTSPGGSPNAKGQNGTRTTNAPNQTQSYHEQTICTHNRLIHYLNPE
jgi:hypothetical protein